MAPQRRSQGFRFESWDRLNSRQILDQKQDCFSLGRPITDRDCAADTVIIRQSLGPSVTGIAGNRLVRTSDRGGASNARLGCRRRNRLRDLSRDQGLDGCNVIDAQAVQLSQLDRDGMPEFVVGGGFADPVLKNSGKASDDPQLRATFEQYALAQDRLKPPRRALSVPTPFQADAIPTDRKVRHDRTLS
jgi:hypothetical protein